MPHCQIRECASYVLQSNDHIINKKQFYNNIQILRRSSDREKFLIIVKYRTGHMCHNSWIVVSIVAWEGVAMAKADHAYDLLAHNLVRNKL